MKEFLLAACVSLFIYDGDNVRCDGTTYRLVGHNAPEIRGVCPFERDLARRSRDRLRALAMEPGATLQEVLCYGSNFGRKCAVVRVGGRNVAEDLVSNGLAEPYWCGQNGCPIRRDWCRVRHLRF